MNRWYARYSEAGLSAFKYVIAVVMMISGVATVFSPLTPMDGALGYIYSTRLSLVILGIIFFTCGAILLYGKVRRSRKWTGRGLFYIFCCLLFGTIIQGIAYSWNPGYWLSNAIIGTIMGLLWLRWKMKTEYVSPKHFREDVVKLKR